VRYLKTFFASVGGRWFILPATVSGLAGLVSLLQSFGLTWVPDISIWALILFAVLPISAWSIGGLLLKVVKLEELLAESPAARDMLILDAIYYVAFGHTNPSSETLGTDSSIAAIGRSVEEIQQQARDGLLPIWGRRDQIRPYEHIDAEYWSGHIIELLDVFRDVEDVGTSALSKILGASGGEYRFLMTSRRRIEALWPKN
jgi:hypothetical protein